MFSKEKKIVIIEIILFIIVTFCPLNLQTGISRTIQSVKFRVYDHLLNPREHPDDSRRPVRPPDWAAFGNRTRFIYVTHYTIKDDRIVNYTEALDSTVIHELGDVYQVLYPILFAKNLGDLAEEYKKRGIILFNIYGYNCGSGPGTGYAWQFKVPDEAMRLLESKMGERWLGTCNGENDGQYVGGYAHQMYPYSESRMEQYFNFQRHFEKYGYDNGNKMSIMVSLNFSHYYLKEGVYAINGAETGQALPNSQVYYSFIRGAGKQYGVPWYAMASIFNRWGVKTYGKNPGEWGCIHGPTKGTSLSLLKRLLYSHILYNCMAVGLDLCVFEDDPRAREEEGGLVLSPIGRIQQSAKKWIADNGQPGVMLTPIAVMLDFFSGWSFPRHLYARNVYRTWGNLEYESGDHLTDGVLDMFYPGYQNSSYFHDESGFITPAPYGDCADCILSDAQGWLLERYPVLVIGGDLSGGTEVRDKLQTYVENGGHLLITAGNLAKLPGGLAGTQVSAPAVHFSSEKTIQVGSEPFVEDLPFELYPLVLPPAARITAKCGDTPAVVEIPCGKGLITVLASPFGVSSEAALDELITNEIDKPLLKPYPLLKHVRHVFDSVFRSQMLFEVDERLCLITCRKGAGLYTLGIINNSLRELPLQIISHCGPIKSIQELETDQSEKYALGHLPEGFENAEIGVSDDWHIAGDDVRIFTVQVQEENVKPIPHVVPPLRPRLRALPLHRIKSIKEEILSRPTFFQHFDRVVIDWKYLRQREKEILRQEAGWIKRQKLDVIVDLTSGLNLYPDLRLMNNLERDYTSSMAAIEDIMQKMEIIGSHDLILSLHRFRVNNFTREQASASFDSTLKILCKKAKRRRIKVHLRTAFSKPPENLKAAVECIDRIGASNFRLAPSTALLLTENVNLEEAANLLKGKVGMWLVSAPEFDISGHLKHANAPIANYKQKYILSEILSIAPRAPLIMDCAYKNYDEEYLDVRALNRLVAK